VRGATARFPSVAACILTLGVDATLRAKQATATIPIVMAAADDDGLGLIASFAR